MTTLEPPIRNPGLDLLLGRLGQVQSRRWRHRLAATLLTGLTVGGLLLLAVSLLGYWPGQPPAWLRYALLGLLLAGWSAMGMGLIGAAMWRANPKRTARFLEQTLPELHNDLINPLLLAEDVDQASPLLVNRAIDESVQRVGPVNLKRLVPYRKVRRAGLAAILAGVALATFAILQPGPFHRGLAAVLNPGAFVPADNDIDLIRIIPGDVSIFPGQRVTFKLTVANTPANDLQAYLHLPEEKHPRLMFLESANETRAVFTYHLEAVHQSTPYYLTVAGAEGESRFPATKEHYLIDVRPLTLEAFTADYVYPEYTRLKPHRDNIDPQRGLIKAPIGAQAKLSLRFNQPVARGLATFRSGKQAATTVSADKQTHQLSMTLEEDDAVTLVFLDDEGRILKRLPTSNGDEDSNGALTIRAIADQPPTVRFISPNRNLNWPAGKPLPLSLQATDDYEVADLKLFAGREGQTPAPVELPKAPAPKSRKSRLANATLPTDGCKVNDVIVYFATATDNRRLPSRGGPQTAASAKFTVTLQTPAQSKAEKEKQFDQLQKAMLKLLEEQLRQRVNAAILRKSQTLPQVRRQAEAILAGQKAIHAGLDKLVKTFAWTPAFDEIRNALNLLAANEARLAVEQAEAITRLTDLKTLPTAALPLADSQNAIIHVLQDLLAVMPAASRQAEEKTAADGTDLSDDQRKKLKKQLQDDLKKFIEEHKKIIAATERLNKKPLDDFTPADMKLLKDLAAMEDKWEKFLNEKFTDFSKLDAQDFSNPSLLKELLAVKCDVTMAKDALSKKATEIATAAESNGVENAEELTANIEKWLPDEPDRKKWAMEAPEDQRNIELAELSGELEDLVGDLLEDEEDLFEEMDDLSSKAAMSGDKGIGWDAMDGPISSMNAQGVTGNQLPNSSEISGRSGEGRTGKSAGEFVEDKAVGKGGRRTPTRMSDDPFQKGEINDVSTDPPGGATGGGKHSGSGEEGLEGAAPAEVQRQMKTLAGKQAKLINRAERIQAKFQTGSYAAFKLNQAVLLMNRVQTDLEKGQYQNAMRRRKETIQSLQQSREMVNAKLNVQRDDSAAMPKYLRDGIRDAMNQPLPEEYRDMLQKFYQRINE